MAVEKLPWVDSDQSAAETETKSKQDVLTQLAGVTGLGWTTSLLGFLSSILGYGNGVLSRLVAEPQSFLYVGAVFFLATIGLDRLVKRTEKR